MGPDATDGCRIHHDEHGFADSQQELATIQKLGSDNPQEVATIQ